MKKYFLILFLLFFSLKSSSQIATFIGFDQVQCADPMVNVYSDSTTAPGCFKVFRNGVEVFSRVYYWHGLYYTFNELVFINDSTGFLVFSTQTWAGDSYTSVYKTADYGSSWIHVGMGIAGYCGIYVVNKNYAYLVCHTYPIQVTRCSDIQPPTLTYPPSWSDGFINDPVITTDIYKTDTIFGSSLCNIDSLNIFIQNSAGDTVDYHINIDTLPYFEITNGPNFHTLPNEYTVYPTPANNKITIEGVDFAYAEIYSLEGKKIFKSFSKTINIDAFSKGLYFLKISNLDGRVFNSKFIKE